MIKKLFTYLGFTLLQLYAFAQPSTNPQLHSVVPPSPDAASLGKYGDIPVSLSTGTPNISVPVYTITQSGLEIPISISYHAGGIKVEENASWVGLGWSLNAGGVITRSVVGLPDEDELGYWNQTHDIDGIPNASLNTRVEIADEVRNGLLDLEPDIFYFNFLGRSGKFYIDKTNMQAVVIPQDASLLITFTQASNIITGWNITDEKGNVYHFQTSERSLVIHGGRQKSGSPMQQQFRSTWYLNSITTPYNSTITFTYQDYTSEYYTRQGSTKYYLTGQSGNTICETPATEQYNFDHTIITGKRISAIEFDNGRIVFTGTAANREDIPGDYALDKIEVFDSHNNLIRDFHLSYTYFQSNVFTPGLPVQVIHTGKRLRLDAVDIGPLPIPQHYSFEYNDGALPSIFAFSQDHWGYNNGASNQYLIPLAHNQGAPSNRLVNESAAKRGTLQKINYPTGGSTEFFYNSNEALITEQDYFTYFHPYGGSSQEYLQPYFITLFSNGSSYEEEIYVDPSTTTIDAAGNNFTYNIYLNNFNTCPGNEKPCVGNLRVTLTCIDCDPPNSLAYDLTTMNDYENGASSGKVKLIEGKTYLLRKFPVGSYAAEVAVNLYGNKYMAPTNSEDERTVKVGGLRISKMVHTPVSGAPMTTEYYYTNNESYSSGNYITSGKINGYPVYHYIHAFQVIKEQEQGVSIGSCYYKVMSSSSLAPLATSGSAVTYATVQKAQIGTNEKLKSIYKYTTSQEFADVVSYEFPYTLIQSKEYKRGLLLEEQDYLFSSGQFLPLRKREYTYEYVDYKRIPGMKVACNITVQANGSPLISGCGNTLMPIYGVTSEWVKKVSEKTTEYSAAGTQLIVQTDYQYENSQHKLPTRITTRNSKGQLIHTKLKYPLDFAGITATDATSAGIKNLVTKHVISPEIEKSIYRADSDGNNERLISSLFSSYKNDLPLPDGVYAIESAEPLTDFSPSAVQSGAVNKDSRYQSKVIFDLYDSKGNVLQQRKADDINQSYIWDYDFSFPVAQIVNADQSSVAYTSFEADGAGSWTIPGSSRVPDGITGSKCYQLSNGSITRNNLNASAEYFLTYWVRNGGPLSINGTQGTPVTGRSVGQWTFITHLITGVTEVNLTGGAVIDELRLYPKGAMMTTFTYESLIGMTSQCDATNKINYYEYDGFGRLKLVRDLDKNIVKKLDYQLQSPVHGDAIWTATGTTRCKPCATNTNFTVDILQNEEKDTNPNSPTYNQTRWVDGSTSTNCVVAAWQNTATAVRCKKNVSNQNTGEQEQEQKDMNPCSPSYNQTRWVVVGTNTTACPPPLVYAKIILTNLGGAVSDVVVAFFEDEECTIPVSVSGLVINWQEAEYNDLQGDYIYNNFTTTCNGESQVLIYGAVLYGPGPGQSIIFRTYHMRDGAGYLHFN